MYTVADLHILCLVDIFSFISEEDAFAVREVCKSFKEAAKLWVPFPLCPSVSFVSRSVSYIKWARTHKGWEPTTGLAKYAARRGDYNMVRYLLNHDYPVGESAAIEACYSQDRRLIKLLKRHGVEFGIRCARIAAETGRNDILQLTVDNDDEIDESVIDSAILSGNVLLVLKLIRKYNWIVGPNSLYNAVKSGDLSMCKMVLLDRYMCDASVPSLINSNMTTIAAGVGDLCILEWLTQIGMTVPTNVLYTAFANNHPDCFLWALKNGCHCPQDLRQTFTDTYGVNV